MLSVLHNSLALSCWCKYSNHWFSTLSPDICEIVGKTKLITQLGSIKLYFLWNGSISLRFVLHVPVPDTQGLYHYSPESPLNAKSTSMLQLIYTAPPVGTEVNGPVWWWAVTQKLWVWAVHSHSSQLHGAEGGWRMRAGLLGSQFCPYQMTNSVHTRKAAVRLPSCPFISSKIH